MAGQTLREGYAMSNPKAPPVEWMLEAAKELGRQRRHITGYQPVEEVARVIARFAPAPEERETRKRLKHCHELLQHVHAILDPDVDAELDKAIQAELEPCDIANECPAPAPASPTVADHPFQECWGEPHRPEWGPIDGCHSQVAFPCGQPRSAHPSAAPEPLGHKFKPCDGVDVCWTGVDKCHDMSAARPCGEPEAAHAPAPSVQPAACDCWPCANGHPEDCQGPEPAAQDRLGEIAQRLAWAIYEKEDLDCVVPSVATPMIRAELERVVRETVNVLDHDSDNRWDWTGAERARADEYTRAMLDRWGLS